MIDAGEHFLSVLDAAGLHPESAGWLLHADIGDWRYLVVTSAIDVVGRRRLYGALIDLFEGVDFGDDLTLSDVHLVSPHEPSYAIMKGTLSVQGSARIRLTNVVLNGIRVDGVIYRFFSPPAEKELQANAKLFEKTAHKIAKKGLKLPLSHPP